MTELNSDVLTDLLTQQFVNKLSSKFLLKFVISNKIMSIVNVINTGLTQVIHFMVVSAKYLKKHWYETWYPSSQKKSKQSSLTPQRNLLCSNYNCINFEYFCICRIQLKSEKPKWLQNRHYYILRGQNLPKGDHSTPKYFVFEFNENWYFKS